MFSSKPHNNRSLVEKLAQKYTYAMLHNMHDYRKWFHDPRAFEVSVKEVMESMANFMPIAILKDSVNKAIDHLIEHFAIHEQIKQDSSKEQLGEALVAKGEQSFIIKKTHEQLDIAKALVEHTNKEDSRVRLQ